MRRIAGIGLLLVLGVWASSCGSGGGSSPDAGQPADDGAVGVARSAALVGRFADGEAVAQRSSAASVEDGACPNARITVNGSPVTLEFGPDCTFVVSGIPSGDVTIGVEIDSISGTFELPAVQEGELIEVVVHTGEQSLAVEIERRAVPDDEDLLPEVIEEDDVTFALPGVVFDQTLTVNGRNVSLLGAEGDHLSSCDADGWTTIAGDVTVNGDEATLRNLRFLGDVFVAGDGVLFIHSCFSGKLVTVGDTPGEGPDGPAIDIRKQGEGPDTRVVPSGADVDFTIAVINTGDGDLVDLEVTDPELPDCARSIFSLPEGTSLTYTCTALGVTAGFINTACVTGEQAGVTVQDCDTSKIEVPGVAAVDIRKQAKGPDVRAVPRGSDVAFEIVVTNSGGVDLIGVEVTDEQTPDCGIVIGDLAAGEHLLYTCVAPNVTSELTNEACVTGAGDDISVTDCDVSTVEVIAIDVHKQEEGPDTRVVPAGSDVSFDVTVVNSGEVELSDVEVVDPHVPACEATIDHLAPGEVFAYTCTAADVDSRLVNQLCASGERREVTVEDCDTSTVEIVALDIRKQAEGPDECTAQSDSDVVFEIEVTNTGSVPLELIEVVDVLTPDCEATIDDLDPGETVVYTCIEENVTDELTNEVCATGEHQGVLVEDCDVSTFFVAGPDQDVVMLDNGYRITFKGVSYNNDGTSTWEYQVDELPQAQDLSNWVLELPDCVTVVTAAPAFELVNPDPNAGLRGIKWETGSGFTTGEFTVTLAARWQTCVVAVAAKGPDVSIGEIAGPICLPLQADSDGDGYTIDEGDCDDANFNINPSAAEICGDGIDQDCSGSDLICVSNPAVDYDGDGFSENEGDCDDSNVAVYLGAPEICGDGIDQDCSGSDLICVSNPAVDYDGDGFSENEGDCDDSNVAVYLGAPEICGDGIDQDCSGSDLICVSNPAVDYDGDGFSENEGDCDDSNVAVYLGAPEICGDGIDQDCSGSDLICVSNPAVDYDGDGFSENEGDCDDSNVAVYLGAPEICGDGIDQDCSGSDLICVSNPAVDYDGDGFSENEGDCDDSNVAVYLGAPEICGDGIDQDCSGSDLKCAGSICDNLNIPGGALPPPGQCKAWGPDLEPGQQGPPVSCNCSNAPSGTCLIDSNGNVIDCP